MARVPFEAVLEQFQKSAEQFADSDANSIDEAVALIAQHRDRRSIPALLSALVDDAQDDAGMFSLIHAAESFDYETYIAEMLVILPRLLHKAPGWASILLIRCSNNEIARQILSRELLKADPSVKEAVKCLCEKIGERGSPVSTKIRPVLMAATT